MIEMGGKGTSEKQKKQQKDNKRINEKDFMCVISCFVYKGPRLSLIFDTRGKNLIPPKIQDSFSLNICKL